MRALGGHVVVMNRFRAALLAASVFAAGCQSDQAVSAALKAGVGREVEGVPLCWCPAGSFKMGSPVGEAGRRSDETLVDVSLTKGFWMGKHEVTQGQWRRIIG